MQSEVGAAGDVQKDAPGTVDRGFEQRAGHGVPGRVRGALVPATEADAHQGRALARHDGLDVGEVEVDQAGLDDQVGDTLHALTEEDRKSTRLNSSHANISYAVFCLKKKNN